MGRIPTKHIINSLKGGKMSEELKTWLKTSDNRKTYANIQRLWTDIKNRASTYSPDNQHYWNILYKKTHNSTKTVAIKIIGSVAACLVISFGLIYISNRAMNVEKENKPVEISFFDRKSKIILSDGSNIWVRSGSDISFDPDFNKSTRHVFLRGEAFFQVEKSAKEFIVTTKDINIRVLGTSFNIENRNDKTYISLLEGKISLDTPISASIELLPGKIAEYDHITKSLSTYKGDVRMVSSWISNEITFNNENLGNVCKKLSIWYGKSIIPEENLKDKFSYTFTITDDSLEDVLNLMSEINPINFKYLENDKIIITNK